MENEICKTTGKICYDTPQKANVARSVIRKRRGKNKKYSTYFCKDCKKYHHATIKKWRQKSKREKFIFTKD